MFNIFFEYVLLVCEKAILEKFPDFGVDFSFNILQESDTNKRGHFQGPRSGVHKLLKMLFADDLVWFAKSASELQQIVDIIKPIFDRFGLIIAEDKTKSMAFNLPESEPVPQILLKNSSGQHSILEHVDAFRYLGHQISSSSSGLFLNAQIEAAWSAFNSNSKVLNNRAIRLKTRIDILESLVRSIMLYSCQAVDLTQRQKAELDALYRSFLRKMICGTWKRTNIDDDGVHTPIMTNARLNELTDIISIENFVEKQFLKFQAHITRLPNHKIQKKLQFVKFESKISENVWSRCKKLMGGMPEEQIRRNMQNKTKFLSDIDLRFGTR